LRFIYKNPEQDKRPGEGIRVTAKGARGLRGRVVFSGAGWYRRDHRNTGLSTVLPRVSRACTLTLWDPDYILTLMAEPVFRGGSRNAAGSRTHPQASDGQTRYSGMSICFSYG
jgi:hypothetical protein